MSNGLFIMYGFLLLLAAGIFIYAKIDDRKALLSRLEIIGAEKARI